MRMRQSLAQFEHEFHQTAAEEIQRRERLRREAAARARARRQHRVERSGTMRFVLLVAAILATTLIVTVVMFQTLALLIGG